MHPMICANVRPMREVARLQAIVLPLWVQNGDSLPTPCSREDRWAKRCEKESADVKDAEKEMTHVVR